MKIKKPVLKALVFVLPILILMPSANSWVNSSVKAVVVGGTSSDTANAVALDSTGNIYEGINFRGTVDFDPTSGTDNRSANSSISASNNDIAFSKYDSSGNRVWTYSLNGSQDDYVNDIVVDSSNNVYFGGTFRSEIDFNPTAAYDTITPVGGTGADIYISKYDSSGNYVWTKTFGSANNNDDFASISIDPSGNFVVCGSFTLTADFDPGASTSNLNAVGNIDAFVVKFNSNFDYLWAISVGGAAGDKAQSIAFSATGDIYVSGYFTSTADFNPGASVYNLTSNGLSDAFILKLDSSGSFLWAKNLGSTGDEWNKNLVVTDSTGSVYFGISPPGNLTYTDLSGSRTFVSNGYNDIEVFKYDSSGTLQWGRQLGGTATDMANSLEIDSSNNLYVLGYIGAGGSISLDPNSSSSSITSNGGSDAFVWKLSSSGVYSGHRRFGGIGSDGVRNSYISSTGRLLIVGDFSITMSVDTGNGGQSYTSAGGLDTFLIELSAGSIEAPPLPPEISISSFSSIVSKGAASTITVSANTQGKVQFLANGKRIPKCVSVVTSGTAPSLTATCSWVPSVQGSFSISVRLTVDSVTAVSSAPKLVVVQRRTGNR
jgi:hypothetical protein